MKHNKKEHRLLVKALNNYTLWCCCGSHKERRLCSSKDCKLNTICKDSRILSDFDISNGMIKKYLSYLQIGTNEALQLKAWRGKKVK